MFTGLIQKIGTVVGIRTGGGGKILQIDTGSLSAEISIGDSVAVNGVCLTATAISNSCIDFDVSLETLNTSTIGSLKTADKVNLELAMQAGSRFGGHIVQGHIDGVGAVKYIKKQGDFYELAISASPQMLQCIVKKGSVAVSGISLTAASVGEDFFTIAVIPATWTQTTLQYLKAGDKVNIETDLIVKAVKSQLEKMLATGSGGGLTIEKLREMGF